MAQQEQQDNEQGVPKRPSTETTLSGGLNKDIMDTFSKNTWSHARNATMSLPDGQTGPILHTEPANIAQVTLPYTLIGSILLTQDQWILFTTNNTYSEIGLYIEGTGVYTTMLNDVATIAAGLPGLNFSTNNLISGASRRNFDCGFDVYWSDGALNPDRMLDTAYLYPNPWVQDCVTIADCITCTNTNKIDINQLRLAPQYTIPCLTLAKSTGSGTLLNGSYQVAIRFAINSIPCTNFVALSNVQSIFAHGNSAGAVVMSISGIDSETTVIFPEIEVVVISMVNMQVQAKRFGVYPSTQETIYIDNINPELITIPLNELPISNPVIDKCNAMYGINNYLLRVGIYEKPDFNYQPLANQITAWWTAQLYPENYYHAGGFNGNPMQVGYLRGETYALYIRWVYTDGEKSASYSIPGLPAGTPATLNIGGPSDGYGGVPVAYGRFQGYSSTENYPNNQAEIWEDLCGQPIMHHTFPDQSTFGGTTLSHFNPGGNVGYISIMGLFLQNILPPIDNNGVLIPNIQGYEILRAVRNGNESILAKGMVNNMMTCEDSSGQPVIFQNFPYNDLGVNNYLTINPGNVATGAVGDGLESPIPGGTQRNDILSFHSPDTVFQQPYLGQGSLQLVMGLQGTQHGIFTQPYKHPMFKTITNFDSWLGDFIAALEVLVDIAQVANFIFGGPPPDIKMAATQELPFTFPLFMNMDYTSDILGTDASAATRIVVDITNLAILVLLEPIKFAAIREQFVNIIKGLIPGRQYCAQYNSSGFYSVPLGLPGGTFNINSYQYVRGQVQSVYDPVSGEDLTINNIYRNNYVLLQLAGGIPSAILPGEKSRFILRDYGYALNTWFTNVNNLSSFYGAYRVPQEAQYGQVDSTKQVLIGCMIPITPVPSGIYTSGVLYGGDTYINRYTEKNPFMLFNDWLIDVPEDFKYDYRDYINVPNPMFWMNNDSINYTILGEASTNRRLDTNLTGLSTLTIGTPFYLSYGYFYLFCNGVRDFYVESSVNVGYRDWEDTLSKMFYDPYGFQDVNQMFRSDIIKSDTLYKYDYSLSADKFINQYISWGKCLDRDYNPTLAYTCFDYYPRRIAYSLPQEEEIRKDNWKVFLPNNYKDMPTNVTAIKDTSKTGAVILLDDQAPLQLIGLESIPSRNSGTEYTVGTGKLFDQALQQLSNVDSSYQYGSCQSRYGIVNTPYGLIWVSQNTGKILHYAPNKTYYNKGESIIDIASYGLKYWLSLYMPSQLLQQFPDYALGDNPVSGVGMQVIYDSINETVYICKKDYKAINPAQLTLTNPNMTGGNSTNTQFYLAGYAPLVPVTLGDPLYFYDCSWTLSYNPSKNQFLSFHDWHPALNIAAKTHFLTTDTVYGTGNILWRHNQITTLFCNYYGQSFPFEIEYPIITGNNVVIIESLEMFVESYNYKANQTDKFLEYSDFFDYALLYNNEQSTLPLIMTLKPWDNPYEAQNFPFITSEGSNIYYTKQEQRYRIGMSLKDFTEDRSQFNLGQIQLFQTSPNGYTWIINPLYLNFAKAWDQQKKIRHFKSILFLRKTIVGNNSISFYFSKTNMNNSPR